MSGESVTELMLAQRFAGKVGFSITRDERSEMYILHGYDYAQLQSPDLEDVVRQIIEEVETAKEKARRYGEALKEWMATR